MSSRFVAICTCAWLSACASAGLSDAGAGADASADAAPKLDAAVVDAGPAPDAAEPDAAEPDAADDGGLDAAAEDARSTDGGARALYVDPARGQDSNDGLRPTPLKTIAHAASLAQAGEEIVLLPGVYDDTTEPAFRSGVGLIRIPDGVSVRADEPGTAELSTGVSEGLSFVGRGRLSDVRFNRSPRAITSTSGAFELAGLLFSDAADSCGGGGNTAPLSLGGTASATLTAGSSTTGEVLGSSVECLVRLSGDAQLTVRGVRFSLGAASIYSGSAMLAPRERSQLHLDRVTVEGPRGTVLHSADDARTTIKDSTFRNSMVSLMMVGERSSLELDRTAIDGVFGEAVALRGEGGVNDQRLVVRDSSIRNTGRAIATTPHSAPPLPTVLIERTEIANATQGVGLAAGNLSVLSSTISGSTGYGIAVNNMRGLLVRRTRITGSTLWAIEATSFVPGGTLDLGTGADPGGNDLRGNNQTPNATSGLRFNCSAGEVGTAVGNLWEPSVQGADGDGRYVVPGGQSALEVTGPQNGRNYQLSAACVLRLAQ